MARPSIGDRELSLLRYLTNHPASKAGDVAAGFGAEHGLARSTVLTMLRRLRAKGYLKRRHVDGVYRYEIRTAPSEATRGAVARFVEKTLGGSVSPIVAWMAEQRHSVTDTELAELEALVARLKARHEDS